MKPSQIDHALIENIYRAAVEPEQWPAVLNQIALLVDADGCNAYFVDAEKAHVAMMQSSCYSAELITTCSKKFAHKDLWNIEADKRSSGIFYLSQELVSLEAFRESEVFHEFYLPQQNQYGVGGVFMKHGPWTGFLGLLRQQKKAAFNQQDSATLQPLIKHLNRAFLIGNQLLRQQSLVDAVSESVDHLAMGILFLNGHHEVVFASNKAKKIIQSGGCYVHQKKIKTENYQENRQLVSLIDDTIKKTLVNTEPGGGVMTLQRKGRSPLHIMVVPFRCSEQQADILHAKSRCIIFLHDPDEKAHPLIEVFSQFYHLTVKQAQVCEGIVLDKSTQEIADEMNISVDGVRHHIKTLFAKTEVKRQSELVRLVMTSLAGTLAGKTDVLAGAMQ